MSITSIPTSFEQHAVWWRSRVDGVELFVRLTPKSARDAIGVAFSYGEKTYLNVSVRAVPENGKANAALMKFLSRELRIRASAIKLQLGGKSRFKHLLIEAAGCEAEALQKRLSKL